MLVGRLPRLFPRRWGQWTCRRSRSPLGRRAGCWACPRRRSRVRGEAGGAGVGAHPGFPGRACPALAAVTPGAELQSPVCAVLMSSPPLQHACSSHGASSKPGGFFHQRQLTPRSFLSRPETRGGEGPGLPHDVIRSPRLVREPSMSLPASSPGRPPSYPRVCTCVRTYVCVVCTCTRVLCASFQLSTHRSALLAGFPGGRVPSAPPRHVKQ